MKYLIFILLFSCTETARDMDSENIAETHETSGSQYILSKDEIIDNVELANNGDAEAAFKLSLHYQSSGKAYGVQEVYWTSIASKLGHEIAALDLLTIYINDRRCDDASSQLHELKQRKLMTTEEYRDNEEGIKRCKSRN